jgi:hypothetical protein
MQPGRGDPRADLAALEDVRLIVAGGWIVREGDTVPSR